MTVALLISLAALALAGTGAVIVRLVSVANRLRQQNARQLEELRRLQAQSEKRMEAMASTEDAIKGAAERLAESASAGAAESADDIWSTAGVVKVIDVTGKHEQSVILGVEQRPVLEMGVLFKAGTRFERNVPVELYRSNVDALQVPYFQTVPLTHMTALVCTGLHSKALTRAELPYQFSLGHLDVFMSSVTPGHAPVITMSKQNCQDPEAAQTPQAAVCRRNNIVDTPVFQTIDDSVRVMWRPAASFELTEDVVVGTGFHAIMVKLPPCGGFGSEPYGKPYVIRRDCIDQQWRRVSGDVPQAMPLPMPPPPMRNS